MRNKNARKTIQDGIKRTVFFIASLLTLLFRCGTIIPRQGKKLRQPPGPVFIICSFHQLNIAEKVLSLLPIPPLGVMRENDRRLAMLFFHNGLPSREMKKNDERRTEEMSE
ncbi:MAG: hypothetical protein C4531_00900 [Desulfurivibrio sp.]|nr:MAG: hypothetical protein C4531_00900 [Desulfurivibrio sp.]